MIFIRDTLTVPNPPLLGVFKLGILIHFISKSIHRLSLLKRRRWRQYCQEIMQFFSDKYVYKRCLSSLVLNVLQLCTLLFNVYQNNGEVQLFVKFVATVFFSIFVDAYRVCVRYNDFFTANVDYM